MLYCIEAVGSDYVKLGYTIDAARMGERLSSLQTGCPLELRLLALKAGSRKSEQKLHRACARFRVRGEWFTREAVALFEAQASSDMHVLRCAVCGAVRRNKRLRSERTQRACRACANRARSKPKAPAPKCACGAPMSGAAQRCRSCAMRVAWATAPDYAAKRRYSRQRTAYRRAVEYNGGPIVFQWDSIPVIQY
jgi:hypothetical protein